MYMYTGYGTHHVHVLRIFTDGFDMRNYVVISFAIVWIIVALLLFMALAEVHVPYSYSSELQVCMGHRPSI